MKKKIILWSCLVSGVLSVVSITTILAIIPFRNSSISRDRNLKIEPFPDTINISQAELDTIISNTEPIGDRIVVLSKLFQGITEENIDNFIIENVLNEAIILIANQDYFFNTEGIKTITANIKIV
ncbi:MAG: hypothetical protein ACRDBR_02490 [Metamycoplasmataceae bacterium]